MLIPACRFLARRLPPQPALKVIRTLLRRSQRPEVTPQQQAALDAATRTTYGTGARVAWSWGAGPLVLFVHGWHGRAAQLAPLAQQIAWEGYRCVCIDVTAHGDSGGHHPSWKHFLDDVSAAASHFGAVHSFVGHSAGGLAMIAASALRRLHADAYGCICAPSHPFPPIRAIQQSLDPPARVLDACRNDIATEFDTTWDRLTEGTPWQSVTAPLLLCYDEKDRFIDHREGDRILQWVPHARLVKTAAHGHARILGSDELARTLVRFLNERSMHQRHAAGGRR